MSKATQAENLTTQLIINIKLHATKTYHISHAKCTNIPSMQAKKQHNEVSN